MNCKKCGNVLNPADVICPSCGEPVNPPAPMTSPVQNVAVNASVQAPMASADVAVNPNVIMPPQTPAPATTVSAVQDAVVNNQVATPMASTDVAVNPNVMIDQTGVSPQAATPFSATSIDSIAPVQSQGAVQTSVPTEAVQQATPTITQAPVVDQTAVTSAPASPVAQVQGAPIASSTNPDNGKKKPDVKFIVIVAVLVILIIGLGIFVGTKLFGGDSKAPSNATENVASGESDATDDGEHKDADDKEDDSSQVAVSQDFTPYGYTFTIPSELKYTQDSDLLKFSDTDNFLVNFTVLPEEYDNLNKDENTLKGILKDLGVKEIKHNETRIDGVKYTIVSIENNDLFGAILFSELDDYHMVFAAAYGKEKKAYDTAIEYASMIIKTGKMSDTYDSDSDKDKEYKISKDMLDSGKIKTVEYKL